MSVMCLMSTSVRHANPKVWHIDTLTNGTDEVGAPIGSDKEDEVTASIGSDACKALLGCRHNVAASLLCITSGDH